MPFDVDQDARPCRKESEALYDAVLRLRRAGMRIYRAGGDVKMIAGDHARIVSPAELLKLAGSVVER